MPSPAAWSSPSLEVPSPAPLSVDDSPASRSRGSSRSRSRVSPRNSNADTQLPPKTAPATLDTNTNAADHNHLSPTSATAKTATATATAAAAPPSPSSQPTTPLGSGSWLSRMFKKGKKEDTVSPPATAPAAVDDGYRSIFASGQEYRAEQDVIALNQNILNTSTIHNHEINIDYESMVSGAVVRGHTYGMEELERQHQTQSSIHFEQPIERKLDDDTRLLIYAPATNTPRIYQYPQKVEKFVPVNLSDRGTPSPSLSPWLATDVSQATTFQPPSVTRTRGASRDVKNRKILKAVLPTPPLTSQPTVKRALPDVMPLSTVPFTNTSASTSPRKSVGFASTTANTKRTSVVNHRRRASSIDGGMDDHYDEVFDDVLADDLDDYEDVDVSEDHGMEDISDDDDKENQYDENFALAEARAFQVIQQQKIKQERELQQHRQKEYQEATKMWL